jgi:Ca2+-transporting ATPase
MSWNENGLTQAEAEEALRIHGPNIVDRQENKGFVQTLIEVLSEPMFLLLIGAAAVYMLLGDTGEGLVLSAFALFSIVLVIVQNRRSEHALDALRTLATPHARVLRDGVLCVIDATEVVPGDVLLIAEGERIAADGILRRASELTVDESILTGESVPVRKQAASGVPPLAAAPGGDDQPHVYAGTLALAGHGKVEVTRTGRRSQMGQIGVSLAGITHEDTLLQIALRKLVRLLSIVALTLSGGLVLWYGLLHGDWLQGVLSAIAFAMSMLPEEFPVALTVFLALGSWRLAQLKVLVRRPAVIETLGAASVLCVDKTGTLTENRMRVSMLRAGGEEIRIDGDCHELPEAFHRVLEYGMLASRRKGVDPMDLAVIDLGDRFLAASEHLHPSWILEREYELTPQLLAMSHAWTTEAAGFAVAAKGAPEAIADLCHFDAERTAQLLEEVRQLAARGLRVIAVASSSQLHDGPPQTQHDYEFTFEGLIGLADPLRKSVGAAVALARAAGIKVAMITGDYPATALAIAREAGIDADGGALTGAEIEAMDEAALRTALARVRVFARVMPAQKLRLVQTLKQMGEVVAMTGDGVNDAPALKAAHIGIAMGARGTDVARAAASVVLLDENFQRIVGGVQMGRRIFDNLRKVMIYITAIHMPLAGLALLPVIMGLPPLLLPVHVALLQMVIDPMCSVAFESAPPEPDLMQRPPRSAADPMFTPQLLLRGAVLGMGALLPALAAYGLALRAELDTDVARTLAIISLMASNLLLIVLTSGQTSVAKLRSMPRAFWIIPGVATLLLAIGLALPATRTLLHFALPTPGAALLAAAAGLGAVLLVALPGLMQARATSRHTA